MKLRDTLIVLFVGLLALMPTIRKRLEQRREKDFEQRAVLAAGEAPGGVLHFD